VYAMGGKPFLALNIAALPPNLPPEIGAEILRGGAEKAHQAGVVIAGGHTVQDKEPKYGLVVVGFVDPQRMITKGGARPGDRLFLTKPLGFGVTTTALKRELVDPAHLAEAVDWMKRLNREAGELALEFGVRGGTDITGFSLLGHGSELAQASRVSLSFTYEQIPFLSGARKYADLWTFPGGASDNRLYFGSAVHFAAPLDEASQMLLFDPQTSGGLLLAVAAEKAPAFQARAAEMGQPAWEIGSVGEGQGIEVV
jgi:selenide,water dikinase